MSFRKMLKIETIQVVFRHKVSSSFNERCSVLFFVFCADPTLTEEYRREQVQPTRALTLYATKSVELTSFACFNKLRK